MLFVDFFIYLHKRFLLGFPAFFVFFTHFTTLRQTKPIFVSRYFLRRALYDELKICFITFVLYLTAVVNTRPGIVGWFLLSFVSLSPFASRIALVVPCRNNKAVLVKTTTGNRFRQKYHCFRKNNILK